MNCEDTIVNLATPMGTGAISVIRCSGKNVLEISKIFLHKKLEPRYAHYVKFKNKNNVVIDDVVVIFYEGPRSYT
jgi:tRNA modification GTPase